jgi:hypothetical protein
MKTFTLDEAQSLLPVLESLLKRAMEGKRTAQTVESGLNGLAQRIFLSGGMRVNTADVAKQRAAMEDHLKLARESIAEIDAIGVQVKDLDSGLLDFPPSNIGTPSSRAFRAANPSMSVFAVGFLQTSGLTSGRSASQRQSRKHQRQSYHCICVRTIRASLNPGGSG